MQIEMDKELAEFLVPRGYYRFSPGDHKYRGFFLARLVCQRKLAIYCDIDAPAMSQMLRGLRYMPKDIEEKLGVLKSKIEDYEKRTGKTFNIG
jgi:hypothetical protein